MEAELRRLITRFLKGRDEREGEIDVTHIPLDELHRVVQAGPADPLLYDCYRLTPTQLTILQPYTSEALDPTRYDYYLEAEAISTDT